MYKRLVKPVLFSLPPDTVHTMAIVAGRVAQRTPARPVVRALWRRDDARLTQTVQGMQLQNPVGLSAGFDKNVVITPMLEAVGFGFATGGSVTLEPRIGNPRPWFHRLPKTASLTVHAGMANKGLKVIERSVKRHTRLRRVMPLFLSVAVAADAHCGPVTCEAAIDVAKKTTEYIVARHLAQAVEINISCPNAGDDQPFTRPELLEQLLCELDSIERTVPFFIKMPNIADMVAFDALLEIIVRHNIQGVTIANLVKDRSAVTVHDPLTDDMRGGLSGAPTRDRSTALIRHAYQQYGDRLTIIGVGGIFSAEQAYEKIRAGASLVALITGMIFEGPALIGRINSGLVQLLERDGFRNITEAIGADHKKTKKSSKKVLQK